MLVVSLKANTDLRCLAGAKRFRGEIKEFGVNEKSQSLPLWPGRQAATTLSYGKKLCFLNHGSLQMNHLEITAAEPFFLFNMVSQPRKFPCCLVEENKQANKTLSRRRGAKYILLSVNIRIAKALICYYSANSVLTTEKHWGLFSRVAKREKLY